MNFLLENGLAEPSDSSWASPSLLVPKPDGSHRLCTDYRKVNALTCADSFPPPRIDDIIDSIGEAKYVTKIDASSQKISVYSNHNMLQFVNKMKTKNQRLHRWSSALQPYNLEIRHIKGSNNIVADLLSRSLE